MGVIVSIEVDGQATLHGTSNNLGNAHIAVPDSHAAQPGRIVIETDGYEAVTLDVDLYAEQLPKEIQLTKVEPTATPAPEVITPTDTPAPALALYVLETGVRGDADTHLIAGTGFERFHAGDDLVVYSTTDVGSELAIALVRVVTVNPRTLSAQTIFLDPNATITPNLRVDENSTQLIGSNLQPVPFIPADAYLDKEGSLYIVNGKELTEGTELNALQFATNDTRIIDAYIDRSILVRVEAIGLLGRTAQVTLEKGDWPEVGTLFAVVVQSTPTPTHTATRVPPTVPHTPTATHSPTATETPPATATDTPVPPPTATPPHTPIVIPTATPVIPAATPDESGPNLLETSAAATVSAQQTIAAIVAASLTAQAPTPQPATPVPTNPQPPAQPTDAPTAAPTEPAGAIEMIYPTWAGSIQAWTTLRWRYSEPLQPGQSFDFILRYIDDTRQWGIEDANLIASKIKDHGNGEYSVEINVSHAPMVKQYCDAKYMLSVIVIELDPYKKIGPRSPEEQVQVAPISTTGC